MTGEMVKSSLVQEGVEMVKSALVQEGVSRAVSFVLGKRKERPSQEDMMERMERLEMAVNEVESVVERTAKMPITGYALINRRQMLKRAYMEGAYLLNRHRKHQQAAAAAAAALALQNEDQAAAAATFSSLARRWVKKKVSSISSLFGWNKSSDDLSLSCDDIRRYERFADFARNFLRDLESGYTLRHYTFCNPLVRYLLEGATLSYRFVQGNIKRHLNIVAAFLEDRGVTAHLTYEYLDRGRHEKSFRLQIMVQVSESTDIIAVGIRCLEAVIMQYSTVFLETAKGELTLLANMQSICRTYIPAPVYEEMLAKLIEYVRPDPACCTTDNHGYRTCPFPDHQVMYFRSVGFSRRLESDSSRSSCDEVSTSVVRHPPTPYSNLQICIFDFYPHFDRGFPERTVVEVLGAAQNHRYESLQQVVHMELPEGLTLDPFFSVRQEIISFKIAWSFQHGGVSLEWKIASKPNGSQCNSMDGMAEGKALQHEEEEEEKESFSSMLSLATDNQLARLSMSIPRLYSWHLKRRERTPITARYKAEHFLSEPGFFRVAIDDLNNLFELYSPGVGLIGCWTLYMMAKHNKEPVGFLNPQLVCEDTIRCDVAKVEEYVTKAMLHHQDKIHILVPYYFHQSHSILIVIVLEHSTVLYLDSRNNSPEKYRLVTELIDRSFAMYISNEGGDTPRQTTMKHRHFFPCHRQPDNREINSGYYVCQHMQEIIIRGANNIEGMKIPTDELMTSELFYIQAQLADFFLSSVINQDGEFHDPDQYYTNEIRMPSPVRWNLSDDYCPKNYECGKFMLPLGQLVEEPWETRRFHRWYMVAAKAGLRSFVVRVPKEAFKLAKDSEIVVDFHDMDRMLRRKDLDIAQVTLFALMQYHHICKELSKTLIYLSPMEINQRCITGFELSDDATDLKGLDVEERQQYRKAVRISLEYQVATYIYTCMKAVEEHGCLLAPYCFGSGNSGHWITFLIYPQHGSAVVLDSLDYPKESYKDFERVLNLMYIEDPESVDIRSEQNKTKYGHNIAVRHNFPCAKQPPGTLLCGFYTCEYLKESEKFSINYSVLMNSERLGERTPINEMSITRTVADICDFIMHNCVHQNGAYFNHESDLALDEKYEKIRNWDQIHLEDYNIADV